MEVSSRPSTLSGSPQYNIFLKLLCKRLEKIFNNQKFALRFLVTRMTPNTHCCPQPFSGHRRQVDFPSLITICPLAELIVFL